MISICLWNYCVESIDKCGCIVRAVRETTTTTRKCSKGINTYKLPAAQVAKCNGFSRFESYWLCLKWRRDHVLLLVFFGNVPPSFRKRIKQQNIRDMPNIERRQLKINKKFKRKTIKLVNVRYRRMANRA